MANYADSRRKNIQYQWSKNMASPEFKMKPSVTIEMLKKNVDLILPAKEMARIMEVKKTDQDTVEINLLNKQAASLGSARAAAHTGDINDSTITTQTFTTISDTFKTSIKQADRDSVFTLAQMTSVQIYSKMLSIVESLETAMLAALNTNKSQVSNTPSLGNWNDDSDYIYKVSTADRLLFFQRLKGFMNQNYYKGQFDVIGDEGLKQLFEHLSWQGDGNSVNSQPQLSNIEMFGSAELAKVSGAEGYCYIAPKGTIGLLDWIPEKNRNGFGHTFQVGGLYYSLPDPWGLGLNFAVHEYATAADNESAAGETQDINIQGEISIDHSFLVPTFSTSNLSAIYKAYLLG